MGEGRMSVKWPHPRWLDLFGALFSEIVTQFAGPEFELFRAALLL